MKLFFSNTISGPVTRANQQAKVRIGLIVGLAVFAVLGCVGFQYFRSMQARKAAPMNTAAVLSGSTTAVLNGLKSPVEIRFYSLLDPANTPESLRAYAKRVNELLSEYERVGNGNIRVVRFDTLSDANADAAAADGIRSFNREKGDACYLGIATSCGDQKESIAELSPDWEPALESDLSRAVAQVNEVKSAAPATANLSSSDLAAAQQAIQSNPNLASASLEDATQMLRDAALAEFKAAVADMQDRTKAVEQSMGQGTSAADGAAQLQKIRDEQTQKIQGITARLHNQLLALQQSKGASH